MAPTLNNFLTKTDTPTQILSKHGKNPDSHMFLQNWQFPHPCLLHKLHDQSVKTKNRRLEALAAPKANRMMKSGYIDKWHELKIMASTILWHKTCLYIFVYKAIAYLKPAHNAQKIRKGLPWTVLQILYVT